MHQIFLFMIFMLGVVLLLPFYRVYKGPTIFDRLLGAAAIGTKTITLVLLFGIVYERMDMFVDISLGYATLNFVGVIAMAKYLKATKGF